MLLKIDPGLMIWTAVTFGIAVFVLWRFAFGPIEKIIDERRAKVAETIEAAEGTRAEAARLLAEYRETLASVRAEAEQILERSRKAGDSAKAEILEEARSQAQRTVEKAQEQLERDVRVALQELKGEIAGLTMLATEQVVGKSLDDDDHRRLIDQALKAANLDDLELGNGR